MASSQVASVAQGWKTRRLRDSEPEVCTAHVTRVLVRQNPGRLFNGLTRISRTDQQGPSPSAGLRGFGPATPLSRPARDQARRWVQPASELTSDAGPRSPAPAQARRRFMRSPLALAQARPSPSVTQTDSDSDS